MTDREKAVVMAYTGFAMLTAEKLGIFYAYVREILGRPVWTHELAIKEVSAEVHEKSEKDFLELCASEDPKELPCQDETGMDERAVKVCNGLNCHVNGHPHTRCHKCPYWGTGPHGSSECSVLAADAFALIRQQQERIKKLEAGQTARVMTLEEVENALDTVVWVEEPEFENFADHYALIMAYSHKVGFVLVSFGFADMPVDCKYEYEDYGKKWRCWTQRPTDEQRKAVKWE